MKTRPLLFACCVWFIGSISITEASTIHDLAAKGELAKIKALLELKPELVNAVDEDENTPLHLAAMHNHADVASYLIDRGADLAALNADGFTPLQHASFLGSFKSARLIIDKTGKSDIYSAVMLGDKKLVQKVLDADPKLINAPDINGDSPLWTAASFGYADIVELLLDKGADVNASGPYNGSPVTVAARKGNLESVRLLLARGADVNACGPDNENPLTAAVRNGNLEVVRLLLNAGADLSAAQNANLLDETIDPPRDDIAQLLISKGAKASIYYAVYQKDIATVTALLKEDPELCKVSTLRGSYTPLHIAAQRNATEIAKLLISKGADPNAGYPSCTPLGSAARTGSKDVVVLLLAEGARINVPVRSTSPLHAAAENDHADIARLLIDKGAKTNAVDNYGSTPLLIAAKRGNKELVGLLIGKKCDLNAKDDFGATPLGWAVAKGHREVAELLRKHGGEEAMPPKDILENGLPGRCEPIYNRF